MGKKWADSRNWKDTRFKFCGRRREWNEMSLERLAKKQIMHGLGGHSKKFFKVYSLSWVKRLGWGECGKKCIREIILEARLWLSSRRGIKRSIFEIYCEGRNHRVYRWLRCGRGGEGKGSWLEQLHEMWCCLLSWEVWTRTSWPEKFWKKIKTGQGCYVWDAWETLRRRYQVSNYVYKSGAYLGTW